MGGSLFWLLKCFAICYTTCNSSRLFVVHPSPTSQWLVKLVDYSSEPKNTPEFSIQPKALEISNQCIRFYKVCQNFFAKTLPFSKIRSSLSFATTLVENTLSLPEQFALNCLALSLNFRLKAFFRQKPPKRLEAGRRNIGSKKESLC